MQPVQLVFSWAPKLAKSVRVNIGFPVVRTDGGRSVAVRSRDYQIFWDGKIYLAMGLRPRARFARAWSSAKNRRCESSRVTSPINLDCFLL